jgi:transcription antitermination factor NusG
VPQNECRKRYQRRLVCTHLPLFPDYIFVAGNDTDPGCSIELKEVVRSMSVNDQQLIERELRDIDRLLRSGQPVTREERLQPGALARIVSGPLAGLCGQVLKNREGLKWVLQVHFLQRGLSVKSTVPRSRRFKKPRHASSNITPDFCRFQGLIDEDKTMNRRPRLAEVVH